MSGRIGRRGIAAAAALLAAGCGGDAVERPDVRRPVPAGERTVERPRWEERVRLGGTLEDTLLFAVTRFAADPAGVSVLDGHAGAVRRFGRDGRLAWSLGRKGRGPGEFSRVRDLEVDGAGRTWLVDAENDRVTVIGAEGRVERIVPLSAVDGRPDAVVPLEDGSALVVVDDPSRPLVRVDPAGDVVDRFGYPWPEAARLHPIAAQVVTARHPATATWAAAFALGDGFFVGHGPEWRPYHGWYVEPVAFAAVETRTSGSLLGRRSRVTRLVSPTTAAVSVTLSRERLYVLFAGSSELSHRVVDSYALEDGAYVESFLLPRPVSGIAHGGDVLWVRYETPYPALAAWWPAGARLP